MGQLDLRKKISARNYMMAINGVYRTMRLSIKNCNSLYEVNTSQIENKMHINIK